MSLLGHSILAMALSTAAFVGGHFLMSHPLRAALLRPLGEGGFRAVYSAAAGASLVWMVHAHATAPFVPLWGDPLWARHLLMPVMLVATLFFVLGMTTPNPGIVGAERAPMDYAGGLGIHAVTRHPGLWGFALWALGHLLANGDLATVILTGGIATLAFGGMAGIDARKRAAFPEAYGAFVARTSTLPFVALAQGRARLDWAKIGLWRPALALAVFFVLLFGHGWIIGRSAFPV